MSFQRVDGRRTVVRAAAIAALVLLGGAAGSQGQTPSAAELPDLQQRLTGAREAARTHAEKLKAELHTALRNGGPKAAIGACTTISPDINGVVSETSGFDIGRTALRVRNPENMADPWEQGVMENFLKQLAAGTDHKTIEAYAVTTTREGQKLFRYMRPIMMHESCLACHGPNVALDVKSEIARTYPDDKAVGFNVGEMRGAFTMVQEID